VQPVLRFVYLLPFQLLLIFSLLMPLADTAGAADILINNGLAPPNPLNVIDAADDYYSEHRVFVRNVGCPPGGSPGDPCPSPGAPTDVELVEGGLAGDMYIYDSSNLIMTGGFTFDVQTFNSASASLTGGRIVTAYAYDSSRISISSEEWLVEGGVFASDYATITLDDARMEGISASGSSTIIMLGGGAFEVDISGFSVLTMSGGDNGYLFAYDSAKIIIIGGEPGTLFIHDFSTVTIRGRDFAVDGTPVPYGKPELVSLGYVLLTGTLASGENLSTWIMQVDPTATLRLIPEPSTSLLLTLGLAGLAVRRRWGHYCLANDEFASIETVSRGGEGMFGAQGASDTGAPSM